MNKNNVSNKIRILMIAFCLVYSICFVSLPMTVYANEDTEESGTSYDISWLGGEGNGAFSELEQEIKDTGNSAYRMTLAVGVVGLLIALVICGLAIACSGAGNRKSEKLTWLLWIGIGGVVIFGAVSLVGVFQSIGTNIG